MFSKDGSNSNSNSLLTTAIAALIAASGCFALAGAVLSKLDRGVPVTINFESWSKLGVVRLAIEHAKQPEELVAAAPTVAMTALPAIEQPAPKRAAKKRVAAKMPVRTPKPAEIAEPVVVAAAPVAEPELEPVLITDTVKEEMAAPVQVKEGATIPEASESEQIKMQQMHQVLRRGFTLAMMSGPATLTIQSAQVTIQDELHLTRAKPVVRKAKATLPKKQRTLVAKKAAPTIPVLKEAPVEAIERTAPVAVAVQSQEKPAALTIADTEKLVAEAGRLADQLKQSPLLAHLEAPTIAESIPETVQDAPSAPSNKVASAGEETVVAAEEQKDVALATQAKAITTPSPVEYPEQATQPVSAANQATIQTNNQGVAQPAPPPVVVATRFVEAFDWSKSLDATTTTQFTRESSDSGWQVSRQAGHWSTLSRQSSKTVPLFHENTARLLALAQGVQLQREAGIVFGKLPEGWSVGFSGRAEMVQYLDRENHPVSSTDYSGERYFVLLNAAPGMHLMQLSPKANDSGGAIAVPVLNSTATYVDLTSVKKVTVRGHVYDGAANGLTGLGKIRVRVLGNPAGDTFTDPKGAFRIPGTVTVSDFPVFVETDSAHGFTHRYQVSGEADAKAFLFRFNEEQVQSWIGQLEGGISTESGILLGALSSEMVFSETGKALQPKVTTLREGATLTPEAYHIAPSGQFEIKKPLTPEAPRFISVQLPEGPFLVEALAQDQTARWSRLEMASPGVINVLTQ